MEMSIFFKEHMAIIILIILWVLPWKGYALWLASRNSHKWWFIILFLLNTLAVLDIIYIFGFGRKKEAESVEYENNEES